MTSRTIDAAEAARARAHLAAAYIPCHSCDKAQAGPLHRKSRAVWDDRARRARANDGTDPMSGETLESIDRHLAVITRQQAGP